MKKLVYAPILFSVFSANVFAAPPATESFDVSTTVTSACVILNSNDVPFGEYNPISVADSAQKTTESSFAIRCTSGLTQVSIFLNEGQHALPSSSCASPHRQLMSEENNLISYQIYQDDQQTQIWGCDESNAQIVKNFTSSITPVTLQTFSIISDGQNVANGKYTDIVNVSVRF